MSKRPARRRPPGARPRPGVSHRDRRFEASVRRGEGDSGAEGGGVKTIISLPDHLTVGDLSRLLELRPAQIIQALIKNGIFATQNQVIDHDTASVVATDLGFEVAEERRAATEETNGAATEASAPAEDVDDPADLVSRPPIVTVLGHVDHGKTSLLDRIRDARVAVGEAGGITQHIGAYQIDVEVEGEPHRITFLDTPGHEAFTAMRARGAQLTDIAVLVVAADDGVMPQTREAIEHAQAANVPLVVALNKMDLEGANPDKVKQQLTECNVVIEEYGGDVPCVPVSARTGTGIDDLLANIAIMAEVAELKANPNRSAVGVIVEAKLDKARGPVATALIQRGTLKMGEVVVAGSVSGKLKALLDDRGRRIRTAGPAMPVELLGLNGVPSAGDRMIVARDEKTGRQLAQLAQRAAERATTRASGEVSLEDIFTRIQSGEVRGLNLVVKADVQGSIEPLVNSLEQLEAEGVRVKVLRSATGNITETDVMLAAASKAIIIGFNVRVEPSATSRSELQNVDIRLYDVIYEVVDDVQKALTGLLGPRYREVVLGHAEIRQLFPVRRGGAAAGCYVTDGQILRSAGVRVLRGDEVLWTGKIGTLRRVKEDVREVNNGFECGIVLDGFSDFREGDVIESFTQEQI